MREELKTKVKEENNESNPKDKKLTQYYCFSYFYGSLIYFKFIRSRLPKDIPISIIGFFL